jgi:hypothetical protein
LVAAKKRKRLAVSKRAAWDTERFNIKKFNERDVKEHYQVTIRNKSAALENVQDNGDNNRAWDFLYTAHKQITDQLFCLFVSVSSFMK